MLSFEALPSTKLPRASSQFSPCHDITILSLLDSIPTKEILPIILRVKNGNAQPEDLRITTYGQRLARQVSVKFSTNPAKRTEPIRAMPGSSFPGKLTIKDGNRAILNSRSRNSVFEALV